MIRRWRGLGPSAELRKGGRPSECTVGVGMGRVMCLVREGDLNGREGNVWCVGGEEGGSDVWEMREWMEEMNV